MADSKKFPVVCISGSTKFKKEFQFMASWFEKRGYIVLTTHIFTHADNLPITDEEIIQYETMYRQQIDMCDFLFVIDKNFYIGEATSKEINYATALGKKVLYFTSADFEGKMV